MKKVLMVCMGNICRSPIAKAVAEQLAARAGIGPALRFSAAGTHAQHIGERPDSRAQAALGRRGYVLDKTRSRRVTDQDFRSYDWILAMDRGNLADLLQRCPPAHQHKIRLFLEGVESVDVDEVPDPYYGNQAGFERVLDLCEAGARSLIKKLA